VGLEHLLSQGSLTGGVEASIKTIFQESLSVGGGGEGTERVENEGNGTGDGRYPIKEKGVQRGRMGEKRGMFGRFRGEDSPKSTSGDKVFVRGENKKSSSAQFLGFFRGKRQKNKSNEPMNRKLKGGTKSIGRVAMGKRKRKKKAGQRSLQAY